MFFVWFSRNRTKCNWDAERKIKTSSDSRERKDFEFVDLCEKLLRQKNEFLLDFLED